MSELTKWNEIFPHWGHAIRTCKKTFGTLTESCLNAEEEKFARAIENAAKIELHVHLEAAVPALFYEELNKKTKLYDSNQMPARRAPFDEFKHFINAWLDNTKLIQQETVFESLGIEFIKDRSKQNIVYSEIHCSAVDFSIMRKRFGNLGEPLSFQTCLSALLKGLKQGQSLFPQIDVRVIVDILWISLPEEKKQMIDVLETLNQSNENKSPLGGNFIVAVGMGGPEDAYSAATIKPHIDRCRELGLFVDIHTGEMNTREEMQHSIQTLEPDRIAHGIAGAPNCFFEKHISMCPLSNLLTGSYRGSLAHHPFAKLFEKGHSVSINTDDPLLFGTTLTLEYVALRRAFGFDLNDFATCQKAAAAARFAQCGVFPHP